MGNAIVLVYDQTMVLQATSYGPSTNNASRDRFQYWAYIFMWKWSYAGLSGNEYIVCEILMGISIRCDNLLCL